MVNGVTFSVFIDLTPNFCKQSSYRSKMVSKEARFQNMIVVVVVAVRQDASIDILKMGDYHHHCSGGNKIYSF